MPGGYCEAAGRVLTILEETWQAIRALHPRGTMHTTGTLTKILLNQTTQSHIFEGGTAHADLARGRRRSVTSLPPLRVSSALADHHDPVTTNHLPGGKPESAGKTRTARLRRST
jgi:hypothetical protein